MNRTGEEFGIIRTKCRGIRKVLTIWAIYTIIIQIDKNDDGESKHIANIPASRGIVGARYQ